MGPRLVSLFDDSSGPLNRMKKIWKEVIVSMDNIIELHKWNRSLLLNILCSLVNSLDGEA